MNVVLPALGVLIVLTVLQDVFATVLFPASGRGLIRKPLERASWALLRAAGRRVHGRRRRELLSYAGPTLVVLTLAAWVSLLLLGWATMYKPALGSSIIASSGPTDTSWTTALYYSGFALTTLGTGDVVATSGLYRMLTIAESGIGFLTFSMVITYFLSVYSNLPGRNAFAQGLHHRTLGTGDAAVLLASMAHGAELHATGILRSTAASLREIYQSHRSYPVLRYFHYRDPEYSLPRMLLTALDTATLIRTVLDPECHAALIRSVAVTELVAAAEDLLGELAPSRVAGVAEREAVEWRNRIADAAHRLTAAGAHVRADRDAAADAHVAVRASWDPRLRALAAATLYDWAEVAAPPHR